MTDATRIPAPVTAVIDAAGAWLPRRLGQVERCLDDAIGEAGPELGGQATSTLAAGGKRMRPLLVLICAGEGAAAEAVRAASAVELIHMATLVHDDVLDRAELRRGQPTVYASAGRELAVAVGDFLFSRALAVLAENGSRRQLALLTEAAVGLALGELAQREDAYDTGITEDRYLERCRLKTGRLFECACALGREAGGGPGPEDLAAYGRDIGLAFQLLDDVLDVTGPPERTGKPRGADLLDGTVTLPLLLARDRDRSLTDLDLHGLDVAGAEDVCDRIAATGALDDVRSRALDLVEQAKSGVRAADLEPGMAERLALVADGVVDRYS